MGLEAGEMNVTSREVTFLLESNYIERERRAFALLDSIMAWEYALATPLSFTMILETHRLLMYRIDPEIAGKTRKCGVYVGGRECPNWKKVRKLLRNWLTRWESVDSFEEAKEAHIEFEKIHPFVDGNGRIGRILLNKHLLEAGMPLHIIHEGEEQMAYYKWFDEPGGKKDYLQYLLDYEFYELNKLNRNQDG